MDELYSIKDRNLYGVMKQSMSARRTTFTVNDNDSWNG